MAQNRKQAGRPDGGQFARTALPESGPAALQVPIAVTDDDIERLAAEISECRQTQNWSPHSTRSSWLSELEELNEAIASGDQAAISHAAAAADAKSLELANRILDDQDLDKLRDRIERVASDFEVREFSDFGGAMAAMRAIETDTWDGGGDVNFSDGDTQALDGFEVVLGRSDDEGNWSGGSIVAFASRRSWRADDYPTVDRELFSD